MVDFSTIKGISIPEGNVKLISSNGTILWELSGGLPSEYQEVEYITGDGNQYIDTNTQANQNIEIRTKIKTNYTPTQGFFLRAYGLYEGTSNSNSIVLGFGNFNTRFDGKTLNASITYNTEHEIVHNKNGLNVDGNFYSYSDVNDFTTTKNIWFFQVNGDTNAKLASSFYYFKIYDDNVLVRDFVPCYRKNDNVIGMYDLVSKTFFTNAGSGSFTKGGDI